ncbi:MAG: smpB [Panacagrimonas sp.]|jgi:SsrA-binding protein|nr:SsrA-binding protein SmpB [Panacagrimonas sp.]MCC2654897.1 smpB [Panacagrimonas sp.]
MTASNGQGSSKKKSSKTEADDGEHRFIAVNRRARHEYFIEDTYEAGLVLAGWEVKSLRDGRAQVTEAYVVIRNREAFLIGAHFTPLKQASTHVNPEPTRTRKLLLHERQLAQLIGKVERAGYTIVPLDLHWTRGRAKLQIGLAKGKKQHDKRADIKEKDWQREKGRLMRARG